MGKLKMKNRVQKLKAVIEAGKMGKIEGVMVTPEAATMVLAYAKNIELGLANMRTLCKTAMSR
jgi:hypothetical protein